MKKTNFNEPYVCPAIKVKVIGVRKPLCGSGLENYNVREEEDV